MKAFNPSVWNKSLSLKIFPIIDCYSANDCLSIDSNNLFVLTQGNSVELSTPTMSTLFRMYLDFSNLAMKSLG